MLENPYYSAQPVDVDPSAFQGEGRFEASPDGQTVIVRWESPLSDSIVAQTRLQNQLGTMQAGMRTARIVQWMGIAIAALMIAYLVAGRGPFNDIKQIVLVLAIVGGTVLISTPYRYRKRWARAIRSVSIAVRGGSGTIDYEIQLDSWGVRSRWLDAEQGYRWQTLHLNHEAADAVEFIATPLGIVRIPFRLFPNEGTKRKFVALAEQLKRRAENL